MAVKLLEAVLQHCSSGMSLLHKTVSLLAAEVVNGDSLVVTKSPYPPGSKVLAKDFRAKIGELDTNATPTGTLSIGFGDIADGAIDSGKALVTDHDLGAAEAWVAADSGIEEVIDVEGLYPILTFTAAAATAAAGDVELWIESAHGTFHEGVSLG